MKDQIRIIVRDCRQVGIDTWDNIYKTIVVNSSELAGLMENGFVVIGAEIIKEE